jgi:hypothetical protein
MKLASVGQRNRLDKVCTTRQALLPGFGMQSRLGGNDQGRDGYGCGEGRGSLLSFCSLRAPGKRGRKRLTAPLGSNLAQLYSHVGQFRRQLIIQHDSGPFLDARPEFSDRQQVLSP